MKSGTVTPRKVGLVIEDQPDAAFDKAIKEAGEGEFLDKDFLPEANNLIPDWTDTSDEVQSLVPTWKTYKWCKVKDIKSLNDDEG
jgi:hypothetical protein